MNFLKQIADFIDSKLIFVTKCQYYLLNETNTEKGTFYEFFMFSKLTCS